MTPVMMPAPAVALPFLRLPPLVPETWPPGPAGCDSARRGDPRSRGTGR